MTSVKHTLFVASAGMVIGIISVFYSIAYAAMIFSGPLAPFLFPGVGMMLIGAAVIGLLSSLTGAANSVITVPQYRIVPLFALLASVLVAEMPGASGDEKFATVAVGMHISVCITGLVFLLLGKFKSSGISRYIPTPVIGGFLAGCGWLFIKSAFPMLAGLSPSTMSFEMAFNANHLFRWVPSVLAGTALVFLMRWTKNPVVVTAAIMVFLGAFYGYFRIAGTPLEDIQRQGWLLGSTEGRSVVGLPLFTSFLSANWHALSNQAAYIFTIVTVSVAAFLQGATRLEIDPYHQLESDGELASAGLANIASAFAGGIIGFQSPTLSDIMVRFNIRSKAVNLIAGLFALAALGAAASILPWIPYALVGGLLFYFGLSFLIDWLFDSWFRLPLIDYLTIVLIFGTIVVFGYAVGVTIGTIMALVLFAIQYSRVNVVRAMTDGTQVRSNVDRTGDAEVILAERGKSTVVLKLDGYLFFGTANDIYEVMKSQYVHRNVNHPKLLSIVLDFDKVDGLDSTAIVAFLKMVRLTRKEQTELIFCGVDPDIERMLRSENILTADLHSPRLFDDLDHAMEWCEDVILRQASMEERSVGDIIQQLTAFFRGAIDANQLLPFLHRIDLPKGEVVIREGTKANDMFFLESGTLTVELQLEHGRTHRIRRMRPGNVVGEVAFYTQGIRTASVVAAEPCVVFQLSQESIDRMQAEKPPLAILFHEQMASILGGRLQVANTALRAVLD